LEAKIKRQKQKKNVSKYFTRDANKMSGFKQLKKNKGGEVGQNYKPAWNNEGASLKNSIEN
jgi:hypothetical protein